MGRLILYLGGSGSGKSQLAEARARALGGDAVLYLTTLTPDDDPELDARLARHRQRRPTTWRTAPWDAPPTTERFAVCLVDGTGGILAARMADPAFDGEAAAALAAELLTTWERLAPTVIVVADEVGLGVVPATLSGRRFRDLAGRFHQRLAALADEAYLVVAGRSLRLDSAAPPWERLVAALERLAPPPGPEPEARALRWSRGRLVPVPTVAALPLERFVGLERERRLLTEAVRAFARGAPPVHVLLWGPPGVGKSSLVKAVWASIPEAPPLVELDRRDLAELDLLLAELHRREGRWLLFLDDLVFAAASDVHRDLRGLLDGSLVALEERLLLVATSNLRQLLPPGDADPLDLRHEHAALAQRFGLRLGIPAFDEARYLEAVRRALDHYGVDRPGWETAARRFARRQGPPSGRLAWQFARLWAAAAALGPEATLAELLTDPEPQKGGKR